MTWLVLKAWKIENEILWHLLLMSKTFGPTPNKITWHYLSCAVIFYLIVCYRKVLRNKGDTSRVSTKSIMMLKSVMILMSKQRIRVLGRKDSQYLNEWANPLFIGVSHRSGYSGDPNGSYFECSRRVDMLRAYGHLTSTKASATCPSSLVMEDTSTDQYWYRW